MTTPSTSTVPDGRRQRSERSRRAIIEATLDMITEGTLIPTAQQVSERAGVGIRSVFRHFEDMESIFILADETRRARYEDIFLGGDRKGTLEERILHAVEQRAKGYELYGNVMLSTLALRWRFSTLRKNYERYQRGLRKNLHDWLPELANLDPSSCEAIHGVASFEFWNRLRDHQNLSKKAAIGIVVQMVNALVVAE
ncbi:MAG: TetR/AcrR family transcriptional regulator [Porticoccaceae bacterium]|jgi:AcrR family transcriptional regulator|nr:TetR/AcrR family transcriptional regulator [Porticoccaceae bacterium]MDG1494626.1 TetR/AcrR family transcriptional regulator [Porticoccaceae bacterium]